ncbi:MAG: orotidine-5'-phosphate decarboxylase [Alphaproteobacteria bacterium]
MKFPWASPLFCAIDTPDLERALGLAEAVAPHAGGFKLGLEFFAAQGADGVGRFHEFGLPLFLDLKLHDIPNTVEGAVRALLPLRPAILTLHASGGAAMLAAARRAADKATGPRPRLLGVTLLTSLDHDDLTAFGVHRAPEDQVLALARLARHSGIDGIVCSAREARAVRADAGRDFLLAVPGIRPAGSEVGDQKRVVTPHAARDAGADILVVGRPITAAPDPAAAARAIAAEIAGHGT